MKERQMSHIMSHYFAPRGRGRMYSLGMQLAQLYLSPTDKLIGIIGEAGSGKSALIRGMFPGLELTNDDDGVYIRPLPLLEQDDQRGFFSPHTYHVDIRFENGFTQMSRPTLWRKPSTGAAGLWWSTSTCCTPFWAPRPMCSSAWEKRWSSPGPPSSARSRTR